MRTALISDIHGNYDGLMAALADAQTMACDRIICLGDLVDGGPDAAKVVAYFQENGFACIQGNHDECPNTELPNDVRDYLKALPTALVEDGIVYTHTSPRAKQDKIKDNIEAWNVFEQTDYRRIFVGDVHVPLLFGSRSEHSAESREYPVRYDQEFAFAPDDRYIVCVGSLGYSRDPYAVLRYAIYDSDRDSVLFRAPAGPTLVF